MSFRTLLLAALGVAVLTTPAAPHRLPTALAAQPAVERHAAGVVIDTGTEVRTVCVRFDEPELTGAELLRRAQVQAVFAEYPIGTAVCALCGVGCPADDCFCESTTTARYWNYSRAGGAGWERSNLGASSTAVRDGDVEGWAWGGEGATPPWIGFESICVEVEATPTPAATASTPATPAPASDPTSPPASAPPATAATKSRPADEAATAAPTTAPATVTPPGPVTATGSPPEPAIEPTPDRTEPVPAAGEDASAVLAVDQRPPAGSGPGGVAAFAAGTAALGLALVLARRRRG